MLNKKDGQTYDFEIEKIDPNGRFFILNFKRSTPYHFQNFVSPPHRPIQSDKGDSYEVLKTSSARCGIVVNGTDNSVWRSVWISEGSGDDINALVKSSIMWASKKEWWNVLKTVSGKYNKISYFVSQGEEFHEPYWVEVKMWYIY
ncbi:hypothetical protein DRQ26_05600 [bacterium]|nr:MAG: hypothetical protein DRQ26_05600 [bacterium]